MYLIKQSILIYFINWYLHKNIYYSSVSKENQKKEMDMLWGTQAITMEMIILSFPVYT